MEKEIKVFFPREMRYGKRIFEGGKVHSLKEEAPGFIGRWLKRGCIVVEENVEQPVVEETVEHVEEPVVEEELAKVEENVEHIEEPIEKPRRRGRPRTK